MLHSGADVDCVDGLMCTPLHLAAGMGHSELVKLLLEVGCNVNALDRTGENPLSYAAAEGHLTVTQILLSTAGIDIDISGPRQYDGPPVFAAMFRRHMLVTQDLIRAGASRRWIFQDSKSRNRLRRSFTKMSTFNHNAHRARSWRFTHLVEAATLGSDNNSHILECILEKKLLDGVELDVLLQDAVWLGFENNARRLVRHGADPNSGQPPMLVAATEEKRTSAVEPLLKLGASNSALAKHG